MTKDWPVSRSHYNPMSWLWGDVAVCATLLWQMLMHVIWVGARWPGHLLLLPSTWGSTTLWMGMLEGRRRAPWHSASSAASTLHALRRQTGRLSCQRSNSAQPAFNANSYQNAHNQNQSPALTFLHLNDFSLSRTVESMYDPICICSSVSYCSLEAVMNPKAFCPLCAQLSSPLRLSASFQISGIKGRLKESLKTSP